MKNEYIGIIVTLTIIPSLVIFSLIQQSDHSFFIVKCIDRVCDLTNWFTLLIGIILGGLVALFIWKRQEKLSLKQRDHSLGKITVHMLSIRWRLNELKNKIENLSQDEWNNVRFTEFSLEKMSKMNQKENSVSVDFNAIKKESGKIKEISEKAFYVIEPMFSTKIENLNQQIENIYIIPQEETSQYIKTVTVSLNNIMESELSQIISKIPQRIIESYQ